MLILRALLVLLTFAAFVGATATPATKREDNSRRFDQQQATDVAGRNPVPRLMASRVSYNNLALNATPSSESDDNSSESDSVLSRIIIISVPSLTGLLLLAILIFLAIRLRNYFATRRLAEDALSAGSSLPPHVFLPEPTHQAISSLKQAYNRGSEGSDAFPDNYRNFYGGVDAASQLSSESSEVNLQKVTLLNEIGSGCFSKVYLAILSRQTKDGVNALQVAVKLLKVHEAPATAQQEMMAETEILRTLGYCQYIINMLGSGTRGDNIYIITEYAELGNLQEFLRSERDTALLSHRLSPQGQEESCGLSEIDLMGFAEQIVLGMEHVARNGVVHGDLASRNILVFSTGLVKISDFGLAHYVSQNGPGERLKGSTLPVRWMPPEGIFKRDYSLKSDIWAFGILLWEIVTLGSTPYAEFTDARLMKKLRKGYRMPRPPYCSNQLYHVMRGCWHNHPDDRPTFPELRELVAHILGECRATSDPTHIDYSRLTTFTYHEKKAIISSDDERYSDVFTGAWASTDSDSSYKRFTKPWRPAGLDIASLLDAEGGVFLTDELSSSTQHLTDLEFRSDDTE